MDRKGESGGLLRRFVDLRFGSAGSKRFLLLHA